MIVIMGDKTSTETLDEQKAADPYGDVALGVECAWPHDMQFMASLEQDAK